MTTYPQVLSESETLDRVLAGASLSRYGDGEFTLAEGRSIINQPRGPAICGRLREILQGDSGKCLVGIPNINSPTPKAKFWAKYRERGAMLLCDGQTAYGSSFVSRPDSAPWIDTKEYWTRLTSLWAGRDVVLVRGTDPAPHPKKLGRFTGAASLTASHLTGARCVREVVAPSVNAWAGYEALLEQIGTPPLALLCLGATATVLAVDLCAKGVHAVDLGHVGMWAHRWA